MDTDRIRQYRMEVVTRWPDSDLKAATIRAIEDRLMRLQTAENGVTAIGGHRR